MENKVIHHIVQNKVLYSILIALIAVVGIATLDFSSSENQTLTGNLEDVIENAPLTLTNPSEGAKFAEGDSFKLAWNYADAQAATTYRVFVLDSNQESVMTEGGITETGFSFDIPYDVVSPEEEMKTFTINVNVEGTQITTSVNVTVVNKERINITQPAEGSKVNEGEPGKVEWQDAQAKAGTTYRVFLTNVNDPMESRIVIAEKTADKGVEFKVPYSTVTEAEGEKTYAIHVEVIGEQVSVQGPSIKVGHVPAFAVTHPSEKDTQQLTPGEEFLVEWEEVATEGKLFSVYLVHTTTNQPSLVAQQEGVSSLMVQVPAATLPGEYRVLVKNDEASVEGGLVKVVADDQEFGQVVQEQNPDLNNQVQEQIDFESLVKDNENTPNFGVINNIPNVIVNNEGLEENTPNLQANSEGLQGNQMNEPINQVQNNQQQNNEDQLVIEKPTFNKTPKTGDDPFATVPGFEKK